MKQIVLFDGVCNFCEGSVQFIIKRDSKAHFQFVSLQSNIGKELLMKYGVPEGIDSIVLIKKDRFYTKSSAALRICQNLNGAWKLFSFLLIIPPLLRNLFYDLIAKNRYKWFGKKEACMLPTPEQRKRFLD